MRQFIPHVCGENKLHLPQGCHIPFFIGLDDETVMQGDDFNLRLNVQAFDADGNPTSYTVSPSEFEPCQVGQQVYTYSIGDDYSRDRIITVIQADDPTIEGLDTVTLQVGESFDPMDGVSATDAHGNPLTVTGELQLFSGLTSETINQGDSFSLTDGVTALDASGTSIPYTVSPNTIDTCDVGTHVFTYTSARGSATRTITIEAIANPTITGADEGLEEMVGVAFDPLDGVSAVDGNGNAITVTVTLL